MRLQRIVLKGMNKDGKKDLGFFLFFHSENDEKKARIHAESWLSTALPWGNCRYYYGDVTTSNNAYALWCLMWYDSLNNVGAGT